MIGTAAIIILSVGIIVVLPFAIFYLIRNL